MFGIDDDDEPPLEPCRDVCCCDDCARIDDIFGIPVLLLLLLLPTFAPALLLFRDGIGPFELLFCGGLCEAFGGNVRSDGRLRSPRSFLCCLLELDVVAPAPAPAAAAAAVLIADADAVDDPCCINFWCVDDDDDEEDL